MGGLGGREQGEGKEKEMGNFYSQGYLEGGGAIEKEAPDWSERRGYFACFLYLAMSEE